MCRACFRGSDEFVDSRLRAGLVESIGLTTGPVALSEEMVGNKESEAVEQNNLRLGLLAQDTACSDWFFDRSPMFGTVLFVARDAGRHLLIDRLPGGQIEHDAAGGFVLRDLLRIAALARTRPA